MGGLGLLVSLGLQFEPRCSSKTPVTSPDSFAIAMPQINLPRNVWVYDNSGQAPVLVAGSMQLGHTTTAEFYACLEICFQHPPASNFRLCDANGTVLSHSDAANSVPVGTYYVISTGMKA